LILNLPTPRPYHAAHVFGFLEARALPGLEAVAGLEYRRRLPGQDGDPVWLKACWGDDLLRLHLPANAAGPLSEWLARVRRLFDLDANPVAIDRHLRADPLLAPWVRAAPGLRVPGAWDGFETAVRAVLGQQVSVARATGLATRLMQRFGDGGFPCAQRLRNANVAAIGMPGQRGKAVRALAAAWVDGGLDLREGTDGPSLRAALCRLPGIGPWTASYIALRVAKDADAFPAGDWVVRKVLRATAAEAAKRAAAWSPWRAYALMHLWHRAAQPDEPKATLSAGTAEFAGARASCPRIEPTDPIEGGTSPLRGVALDLNGQTAPSIAARTDSGAP